LKFTLYGVITDARIAMEFFKSEASHLKIMNAFGVKAFIWWSKQVNENEYEGWANYDSWNVAHWIKSDPPYYEAMVEFMKDYDGKAPYKDFITNSGLSVQKTKDGVKWFNHKLDFGALNDFMFEFSPRGKRR